MLSSLTFYLSLSAILFTLLKLITSRSKPSNLPPGPRKLPFIGNLLLFATDSPHRTLREVATKYGPMVHLKLGEVNTIVVSSPQVAKEFLKTHDVTFAFRPSLVVSEVIWYGKTDIAFAPYGEYWRQVRKICTSELLSAKRVQSFYPIRKEEFENLCRSIASNEGSPVNLTEKVNATTYDIITRAAVGTKTKEEGTFLNLIKQTVNLGSGFDIGDMYPSIRLFSFISGLKFKAQKVHKKLDSLMEKIINEHQEAKTANDVDTQEDLLDVLLKFHDDTREFSLTFDNIKSILLDMFGGGSETSSTTIDWAMSEMLKNPNIMEKAQREVRRVFGDTGYVDESKFDELEYLKLVIKETLRLHPPGPLLLPRENSEECEVNGYHVPPKTRVLVNVWAMGRDPNYWDDVESFLPERFSDNLVDFKGNNFEYIPFGAGRRICPGMSFGLANVELPLAMLLYHFDWILPNGMNAEEVDLSEVFGITLRRKNELFAIPIVKKPLAF